MSTLWNCAKPSETNSNYSTSRPPLSSRNVASYMNSICAQAPISCTSDAEESNSARSRFAQQTRGYTLDLFKGFLTWKRESLTEKEHAFLEQLVEEGKEDDLNRAMKVLCDNDIIFPISSSMSRSESQIILKASPKKRIPTKESYEETKKQENSTFSRREEDVYVDGVELVDSDLGIVILQDVTPDEPMDLSCRSSSKDHLENRDVYEDGNTPLNPLQCPITPPSELNRNDSITMGSQLRRNLLIERRRSFVHSNMWKAHRQGLSLTPSTSTTRPLSRMGQSSPFRACSESKSKNGIILSSAIKPSTSKDDDAVVLPKFKLQSSLSNSMASISQHLDQDSDTGGSIEDSRRMSYVKAPRRISVDQSFVNLDVLSNEAITSNPSMTSAELLEDNTLKPANSFEGNLSITESNVFGSCNTPEEQLRRENALADSLESSSFFASFITSGEDPPSIRPANPLTRFESSHTSSSKASSSIVKNSLHRRRSSDGYPSRDPSRMRSFRQSSPQKIHPYLKDDLELVEKNLFISDADPNDIQTKSLNYLRRCMSDEGARDPSEILLASRHLKVKSAEATDFDYNAALRHYDAWDILQDGRDYILPFQILGTSAEDEASTPHVLSPPLMESLYGFLPFSCSESNYFMKYSLLRDGASFISMLQHIRGSQRTFLAIETTDGEVFGAFTSTPWKKGADYYGSGESFLWRMRNDRKKLSTSVLDQASIESEVEFYPWTGSNYLVQFCSNDRLALGGGNSRKVTNGGFGFTIDSSMLYGTSVASGTFDNPPLAKAHPDGTPFEIVNLEIWSMTPGYTVAEAERLEMARLFLEEHTIM